MIVRTETIFIVCTFQSAYFISLLVQSLMFFAVKGDRNYLQKTFNDRFYCFGGVMG